MSEAWNQLEQRAKQYMKAEHGAKTLKSVYRCHQRRYYTLTGKYHLTEVIDLRASAEIAAKPDPVIADVTVEVI